MVVFGHDHIGHGESDGSRAYIENVDHYVDDVITHCMKMQVAYNLYVTMRNDVTYNLGQTSGPSPVPDRTQHGWHDRPQSRPQAPGLLHRDDSQWSPHCPRAAGEPRQTQSSSPSNLLPGRSNRLQIHSIPDICLQGSAAASELGHSSRAHWPAKHEHHNQVL